MINGNFLFLFAAIITLRGENMQFRPVILIWFVFAQSFFKFHKNGDIQKLKAWSFGLWKNDFCRLYNEHARALQIWINFFLYTMYNKIAIFTNIYRRSRIGKNLNQVNIISSILSSFHLPLVISKNSVLSGHRPRSGCKCSFAWILWIMPLGDIVDVSVKLNTMTQAKLTD